MPLQEDYLISSKFSVTGVDRFGGIGSSQVKVPGSFAANMATIAGAVANLMNAAVTHTESGLESDAQPPLIAFDEAESSVRVVLVLKFHQDAGDPDDFEYIAIPSFDASALLPGQPFANPAQTQVALIISNMATAGYTYQGSWVTTRKSKTIRQPVVPSLLEPEVDQLPSGLPDVDNEPGADTTDPED